MINTSSPVSPQASTTSKITSQSASDPPVPPSASAPLTALSRVQRVGDTSTPLTVAIGALVECRTLIDDVLAVIGHAIGGLSVGTAESAVNVMATALADMDDARATDDDVLGSQ